MTLKRIFSVPQLSTFSDISVLLTRVVTGVAFMLHGWPKIQKPFGWMGEDGFAPGIFQALAALAEFGGGLVLIVGVLTPLASLGIAATMIVAFVSHAIMWGHPFVAKGGGPSYELATGYFCIALLLIAVGPGRFSLDRALFGTKRA